MQIVMRRPVRLMLGGAALALLAGCGEPFDFDLRGKLGGAVDTSDAALKATARRPKPDERGIISYPNYQVVLARRGDTVGSVADRIGVPAGELARYNGVAADAPLRRGEVLALPRRVAEPAAGPIRPASETEDLTRVASAAIDSADAPRVNTTTLEPVSAAAAAPVQTGVEPVRHKVERGESAYTIARLYNVSVRALADWNGLGSDFAVREGQYLLIPVARENIPATRPTERTTPTPGTGSPTPTPPSASKPLPEKTPEPAAKPAPKPAAEDLGASQTAASASKARMILPVDGAIIREFSKGRTDGIDIRGRNGGPVKAADSGRVGAITSDSKGQNIIVLKHSDGLLTVYGNVGKILVKKGDSVSRGQKIAEVGAGDPAYVRFGVYKGSNAVDPAPYLE